MGRRISTDETNRLIHPLLSLSFFAAAMAATIAMITALCSFRRKSSPSLSESPASKEAEESDACNVQTSETALAETGNKTPQQDLERDQENEDPMMSKELPLPPRMKNSGQLYSGQLYSGNLDMKPKLKKSASERRLFSNLSIKLPRSLSMARKDKVKEEYNKRKNGKLKPEDSIWMKTIILGEKCKVPDEDEAVIYDAKGRRIPAYRPKSRQSSFIDPNALPDQKMKRVEVENKINQEAEHKQENKHQESDQEHNDNDEDN
ncbi:unnamed protein product [Malus baccata var. baccata]